MAKLVSNLSQAQYAAIGMVACEWAHVEQMLQLFVAHLAHVSSETGHKIATDMGNVSLLNLVLALARDDDMEDDKQPPIHQHLSSLAEYINELRGRRNRTVHGDWIKDRPGRSVSMKLTAKGQLKSQLLYTSPADSISLALKIAQLRDKLLEIYLDHQAGRLAPLLPKSGKQRQPSRRSPPPSSGKTPPSPPKPSRG
jgi:hypothetical protein